MEDGRWKMEDGRWKMGDGRWEMGDFAYSEERLRRWKMTRSCSSMLKMEMVVL
jgi:hypothetical protein